MKVNRVAHCTEGNSDKVYIVSCVEKNTGEFDVVATWGRRGRNLQSQTKAKGLGSTLANRQAEDIFWTKTSKKYVDIESPSYRGNLSMDDFWLGGFLEKGGTPAAPVAAPAPIPEPEPEAIPEPLPVSKDFEVECLNALGMGERFDEGVTYMAEPHKEAEMLWVWDINAEKVECFRERFKVVA